MRNGRYRRQFVLQILAILVIMTIVSSILEMFITSQKIVYKADIDTQEKIQKVSRDAVGFKSLKRYQLMARQDYNRMRIKHMIDNRELSPLTKSTANRKGLRTNYTLCDSEFTLSDPKDIETSGALDPGKNMTFAAHVKRRFTKCSSVSTVAIIIPFRDRHRHLTILLTRLRPLLNTQQLKFHIFVAEQTGNSTFNKGRLMNAGFLEATKLFPFECVIFHDVDLIPEDDRVPYACAGQPTHLSVAVDEMNYKLKYDLLVGGVLNMRRDHFELVNGYSNQYWGWGAEDDDMAYRILLSNLRIFRPPSTVARYKMVPHRKQKPSDWKKRKNLLRTVNRRFQTDGLNNVPYELVGTKKHKLFTLFQLDIGKPPVI